MQNSLIDSELNYVNYTYKMEAGELNHIPLSENKLCLCVSLLKTLIILHIHTVPSIFQT